jgi:lipopolysaccharide transport system permease protein
MSIKVSKDNELIIRPPSGFGDIDLFEYFRYRHLLFSLVRRDIKSQFEQLRFGFVWAVLRPISVMVIFTLFKKFSEANTFVKVPYYMYIYSGLIFWYYFSDATIQTTASLRKDAAIISKIYFPRLITPIIPIFSNLNSLAIASIPFLMMMAWHQSLPDWTILMLPFVLMQCMCLIFGIGTLFAVLTINNRDYEQLLSFVLYLGIFVSCVFFMPEMVPEWERPLLYLNPMTGTLLALRACLFEGFDFPVFLWIYSLIFSIVALVIGVLAFCRAEAVLVDKL